MVQLKCLDEYCQVIAEKHRLDVSDYAWELGQMPGDGLLKAFSKRHPAFYFSQDASGQVGMRGPVSLTRRLLMQQLKAYLTDRLPRGSMVKMGECVEDPESGSFKQYDLVSYLNRNKEVDLICEVGLMCQDDPRIPLRFMVDLVEKGVAKRALYIRLESDDEPNDGKNKRVRLRCFGYADGNLQQIVWDGSPQKAHVTLVNVKLEMCNLFRAIYYL